MNINKIYNYATVFYKAAQILPSDVDSSSTVTQEDKDAAKIHVQKISESAKILNDWINGNISPTTNSPKIIELKRFINTLFDTSKNLKTSLDTFLVNSATNKTIATVEPKAQAVVQNYNAIRPNYISEQWMTQYSTSEEAKAMDQIKDSINFMEKFIEKQKNAEANTGTEPPVPE